MRRFLVRRLLMAIPTLFSCMVLIFVMLRVLPGDIVEAKLRGDGGNVSQQVIEQERHRLGLDKPLPLQFATWVAGAAVLDLGTSMWTGAPVSEEIGTRLALSFELAVLATLIAVVIAVPLGITAALWRDTWVDYVIRAISVGGLAIPAFWFGMIIILVLLNTLNWLPPINYIPFFKDPAGNLTQMIWPALAVGYRYAAMVTRMLRSSLIEVMKEDYIRTARAKGVWKRLIVTRHAMRNAMLPTVTVVGLEFAFLIGGLVVTEQVFNLNGIGRLMVDAVTRNDFTMVQGIVLLGATVFVVTNLVVDFLYALLDPRIRYS